MTVQHCWLSGKQKTRNFCRNSVFSKADFIPLLWVNWLRTLTAAHVHNKDVLNRIFLSFYWNVSLSILVETFRSLSLSRELLRLEFEREVWSFADLFAIRINVGQEATDNRYVLSSCGWCAKIYCRY